jgi:hypothetical protein
MTLPTQELRGLTRRLPSGPADLRRKAGIENAVRSLLLGGVMPLWLGAGLADWYLHRRTRIEDTAGPRESALYSLMFAETRVPAAGSRRWSSTSTACWKSRPSWRPS